MGTSERRQLIVQWFGTAWKGFYAKGGQKQGKAASQRCGMLNSLDISVDKLIKVEGYSLDGPTVRIVIDSESE